MIGPANRPSSGLLAGLPLACVQVPTAKSLYKTGLPILSRRQPRLTIVNLGHQILPVLIALDCFGDLLDSPQPGIPGRSDCGELSDCAGKLCIIHAVTHLPSGWGDVDQPDAVEHAKMFRHGLARHGQLFAECRCGSVAIRKKQIEHPPPRRIPDRGPEVVVDGDRHAIETN